MGLVFSGGLVSALLLLNYEAGLAEQLRFVVNLTAFSVLLMYLYSSAAQLAFLLKDRQKLQSKAPMIPFIIAGIALIYSFWTLTGAGHEVD